MDDKSEEKNEPMCECGKPKSLHNVTTLVAAAGAIRNGPYADKQGQVFCWGYREMDDAT
jgi:hypothetical protein